MLSLQQSLIYTLSFFPSEFSSSSIPFHFVFYDDHRFGCGDDPILNLWKEGGRWKARQRGCLEAAEFAGVSQFPPPPSHGQKTFSQSTDRDRASLSLCFSVPLSCFLACCKPGFANVRGWSCVNISYFSPKDGWVIHSDIDNWATLETALTNFPIPTVS